MLARFTALVLEYPWLPLLAAAGICILTWLGFLVEQRGILGLFPWSPLRALTRPLFDLLGEGTNYIVFVANNVLRVGMLTTMELSEDQRKELLTGMDPNFRVKVFQKPSAMLLPWPLRRLLMGRSANTVPRMGARAARGPRVRRTDSQQSAASAAEGCASPRMRERVNSQDSLETFGTMSVAGTDAASSRYQSKTDSLMDLVRNMESMARNSKDSTADVSDMERIITEKMVGSTGHVARTLVTSAQASALETIDYGFQKASDLKDGVKDVVADPRTQATAVSATTGAVALGVGGGATGLVSGGAIGAALGIVPAVFTFGLSIPIGAAIGGGLGMVGGASVGGTTGLVGGGLIGWRRANRAGSDEDVQAVEDKAQEAQGAIGGDGASGGSS